MAEADGGEVRFDVLHRVVDGEEGVDVASGRVDVETDVPIRVLGLQVQQLGTNQVGDGIVDRRTNENDVLLEQAGLQVEGPLPAVGLLDHCGNEIILRL